MDAAFGIPAPTMRTEFQVTVPVGVLVAMLDAAGVEVEDITPDDPRLSYVLRWDTVQLPGGRWGIVRAWYGVVNPEGDANWNAIDMKGRGVDGPR